MDKKGEAIYASPFLFDSMFGAYLKSNCAN